jgi:hypothetical protein
MNNAEKPKSPRYNEIANAIGDRIAALQFEAAGWHWKVASLPREIPSPPPNPAYPPAQLTKEKTK